MANEHPFQMLFETLGRVPLAHADSVNRQAYDHLYDILSVPVEKAGRCILLRAPRAGHGKTHLLSRIQHHLGATHEFIPLHPAFGCQIDAATVIDDTLRRLLRPLPASGGLCVLDLVTRRLFAAALQPLVGSGEVPCQDREGALSALRTRPIETFDFHHPNAVTAHWARENFEVLGQRLSVELAQRCELPIREVAFWVDALFRFAATPVENPVRLRVLADVVHAGDPGEGVLMERLEALLGMLAQLMRVVLVADDLEGFSTDESAALRLAAFLGAIRQSVERLDVILSLNLDIWENAFVPRLSGGLTDRLSEVVVELNPLTEDEMVALLESRVPGLGSRVLSKVDKSPAVNHARGLIRAAGVAWLRASAMDTQSSSGPTQAPPSSTVEKLEPATQVAFEEPAESPAPVSEKTASEAPAPPPSAVEPVDPTVPAAPEPIIPAVDSPASSASSTPAERAPDPTLAISFLAAEAAKAANPANPWAPPEKSADPAPPPVAEQVSTPVFTAPENSWSAPASTQEPLAAPAFTPAPEVSPTQGFESAPPQPVPSFEPQPAFQPAPAVESSPFQAAPAEVFQPAPPVFQAAPEAAPIDFTQAPQFAPSSAFQAAPESPPPAPQPAFQAAPQPPPSSAFEAAPAFQAAPEAPAATVFEAAPPMQEPAAQQAVPDTDRVDDLLRQFRERYGRGSL